LDQQKSISRIETHARMVFPAPAEYFTSQAEILITRFSYIRIPDHHRSPPGFDFQSLNLGSSSSHCPVPCWRVLEISCCRTKKLSGDNHSIIASRFAAIECSISESIHSLSLYLPSHSFEQEDQDQTLERKTQMYQISVSFWPPIMKNVQL
jgi:hypothetical protein